MNHIGDTNKMVSDTPRTNAARQDEHDPYMAVASECSKMECELNTAHESLLYARGIHIQKQIALDKANHRIKRLEEAVEAYRTAYTPDGHFAPHDCFSTGPKTGNPIEDLVACPGCWAECKAKEAKL